MTAIFPPKPAAPLRLEVGEYNDTTFAAVIRKLANHPPFQTYAVGVLAPAVRDQLAHGANVMGIRDGKLVAYSGWLRVARAEADRWLRHERDLPLPDWARGDAAINTIYLADDPADLPGLTRAISHMCAGVPVYRLRVFNDGRVERKKSPITGRRQSFRLTP